MSGEMSIAPIITAPLLSASPNVAMAHESTTIST